MKNSILIVFFLMLSTGCASLKYPNWDKVYVDSSVENKPCIRTGIKEQCNESKDDCEVWFQKRATLVNGNAAVVHGNPSGDRFTGKYFQCRPGLPPYKGPKFNKEDYISGSNTVTGQAFLTQKGGGVVTCAGQPVLMYPDNEYFADIYDELGSVHLSNEEAALIKAGQCDAQGNFEFHKVPAGKWIIRVNVSWHVSSSIAIGHTYFPTDEVQGGPMSKQVTVQNEEINKFIISQ